MTTERVLLVVVPLYLIFSFGRRLFWPEGEVPASTVSVLRLGSQLAMIVGVVGLSIRRLRAAVDPSDAIGGWMVLPAIGLLAGVGFFLIPSGGGSRAESPRREPESTIPSSPVTFPDGFEKVVTQMEMLLAAYDEAHNAVESAPWVTAASKEDRRKLPRTELKAFIEKQRELIASIDRILAALAIPEWQAQSSRFIAFAEAHGKQHVRSNLNPEKWRLLRRIWTTDEKVNVIVELHWDEWHAENWFADGEKKPWQNEVAALSSEIKLAKKENEAFLAAQDAGALGK